MKHYFVFHFDHGGQLEVWTTDGALAREVKDHKYSQNSSCYFRGPLYRDGDRARHRVDMTKVRYFAYWTDDKEQGL